MVVGVGLAQRGRRAAARRCAILLVDADGSGGPAAKVRSTGRCARLAADHPAEARGPARPSSSGVRSTPRQHPAAPSRRGFPPMFYDLPPIFIQSRFDNSSVVL